jgi:predicted dehydrogenase
VGRQGLQVNLRTLVNMPDVQIVAVCEVDKWRLNNAKGEIDKVYANADCKTYADWREVVARNDIDAIMNSTPDRWHVPISLAAVRAGKHVSCEKPLTRSIAEGRELADAVKKHGIVFRTDSECRSEAYMHKTAELVRNGYIGNVQRIEVGVPRGDMAGGNTAPMPVPEELDYDMWMGPIARKPYTVDAVHPRKAYTRPGWMRCLDSCEGMITNWGTHVIDVAQQANNSERTGPVSIEGQGTYPEPGSGLWNVLVDFKVQYQYANGVIMDYLIDSQGAYLKVIGDEGWIQANWYRPGGFEASDINILRTKFRESDLRLPQRGDKEDFIHCIKNNAPQESMADAEVGHRTCSVGQLAHIAIQRGKKLTWDPKKEQFQGDKAANKMLKLDYRSPWGLNIKL